MRKACRKHRPATYAAGSRWKEAHRTFAPDPSSFSTLQPQPRLLLPLGKLVHFPIKGKNLRLQMLLLKLGLLLMTNRQKANHKQNEFALMAKPLWDGCLHFNLRPLCPDIKQIQLFSPNVSECSVFAAFLTEPVGWKMKQGIFDFWHKNSWKQESKLWDTLLNLSEVLHGRLKFVWSFPPRDCLEADCFRGCFRWPYPFHHFIICWFIQRICIMQILRAEFHSKYRSPKNR